MTDRAAEYADSIAAELDRLGYRTETDHRVETLGYRIREAQKNKIPYMVIVGDRDTQQQTISVRHRSGADLGAMPLGSFLELIKLERDSKEIK